MPEWTCPQCQEPLDPFDRFCAHCGAPVEHHDSTGVIPAVDDSGPLAAVHAGALDDLSPGTAALVVRRGPGQGSRFVLDSDEITIGRASEANLFLDDVTVSRNHATLVRLRDGWRLEDAGSLNGTYVNRQIITEPVLLGEGDEVQIGKYRFVLMFAPGSIG